MKGAFFSDCERYRYMLVRGWEMDKKMATFIGLNPSTADALKDDPTIRRCTAFAKSWDCGSLMMINAYAFRATDPSDLKLELEPVGPDNDIVFENTGSKFSEELIIAAWGTHCDQERAKTICEMIDQPIQCLGFNKDGSPKHPLYIAADTPLQLYWDPDNGFAQDPAK